MSRATGEQSIAQTLLPPRRADGYWTIRFSWRFETADGTMLGHNRKMTGAECLADMLAGYGVTHVFMVPAVLRRTFAEMERRTKIARVHCHGEKSAAYMADGYARASGKPGICMAQVIGALNLAAGLRDA